MHGHRCNGGRLEIVARQRLGCMAHLRGPLSFSQKFRFLAVRGRLSRAVDDGGGWPENYIQLIQKSGGIYGRQFY